MTYDKSERVLDKVIDRGDGTPGPLLLELEMIGSFVNLLSFVCVFMLYKQCV